MANERLSIRCIQSTSTEPALTLAAAGFGFVSIAIGGDNADAETGGTWMGVEKGGNGDDSVGASALRVGEAGARRLAGVDGADDSEDCAD
jgi:hypothetical protein